MDRETRNKVQHKLGDLALLNYKMLEYVGKKRNMKILYLKEYDLIKK